MATLSQAKTIGGVGSILGLLAAVPGVGTVLAFAGAIMTLIAIKYVSDVIADPSIFRNMIIAVVVALAGMVVGVLVVITTVFRAIGLGAFANWNPGYQIPGAFPTGALSGDFVGLILGVIAGLAILWILLIVSAVFVRKSYGAMATKLGVGMFGTAGLLYLIGAALTIVLVGFILILIAQILNIVAFFSIPDQPRQPMQPQPAPV